MSVDTRSLRDDIKHIEIETLFEMVDMRMQIVNYEAELNIYTESSDSVDSEFMYMEATEEVEKSRKNIFEKAWDFIVGLFKSIKDHLAEIFKIKKDVPGAEKLVVPERYGADASIISSIKAVATSVSNSFKTRKELIAGGLALIASTAVLKAKLGSKKGDASKVMSADQVEKEIIEPSTAVLDTLETAVEHLKDATEHLDQNQTSDTNVGNTSTTSGDDKEKKGTDSKEGEFSGKTNGSIISTILNKVTYVITKLRGIVDYVAGLFLKATGRDAKGYEGKTPDIDDEKSEDNK